MKKSILFIFLFYTLSSFLGRGVSAEIIWDYSPDGTGAVHKTVSYTNQYAHQHMAEKIVFNKNISISGMDIYSGIDAGEVGQQVKIIIWSDNDGIPGVLLNGFEETINIIDNEGTLSWEEISRKHVDFSETVVLPAGSYWIGMSGATDLDPGPGFIPLGQATLRMVDDDGFAWFKNGSFVSLSIPEHERGDMAFRLHGSRSQATWMIDTVVNKKFFNLGKSRSIAVDSTGVPHIVYGGDHLYHAYYEGGLWHEQVIDSAPGVGLEAAIAIDAADKIHIMYENYLSRRATSDSQFKYATNASGTWVIESLDIIPEDTEGQYTRCLKMATDSSGKAHLVYVRGTYNIDHYDYQIMHATNVSGEWVSEMAADMSGENAAASGNVYDIAIADDGSVHILTKMWPDLKDVTNVSGAWVKEKIVGVWNSAGATDNASICLDNTGTVHIAYSAQSGSIGDNYMLKYAFRSSAGGWITDTAPIDPINIKNAVGLVSIAVDHSNIVHVVYVDLETHILKYARGVAGAWTVENITSVDDYTRYNSYGSIAVANSGVAHISYWDADNAAVKYAANTTGSWLLQTVQDGSFNPYGISMASDLSGQIHISYTDSITSQLHYAAGTYGNWLLETINDSGWGNQLAIGSDDKVHIMSSDKSTEQARHVVNNGGSWTTTLLDFEWDLDDTFTIDESGQMHVNYMLRSGAYPDPREQHLMYAIADAIDVPWDIDEVTVATTVYQPEYLPEELSLQSMVIDIFGNGHIIYVLNDTQLVYTNNITGLWEEETIVEISEDDFYFDFLSLAVDKLGHAHVIYGDLLNDNWDPTRMLYINNVSDAWATPDIVIENESGLKVFSIDTAFDSKDQLHLIYTENDKGLVQAVRSSGLWTSSIVDATPSISEKKIVVDKSDNVHIVYREYGDRGLKYATESPNGEWGPDGTDVLYDGNGDGIPDSEQSSVASFHSDNGENYMTLAVPVGAIIQSVEPVDNPAPINTPEDVEFPFGFIKFNITDITFGASVTVHFYLPEGSSPSTYWKYGPTPDNPYSHWYEFLFDETTGAEFNGNEILLHFVDGQRGDHDLIVNGAIVGFGAPGFSQSVPGDLNGDGDVDRNDIYSIAPYRNKPASICPECDLDGDATITVLDMRTLVGMCTYPQCAIH